MADNGVRGLAPIIINPGTTMATGLTVPTGKEWTVRLLRATNYSAGAATISASFGASGTGDIAFNTPLAVAESKNILGPDFCTLPAGTVIQFRASAATVIRVVAVVTERDV